MVSYFNNNKKPPRFHRVTLFMKLERSFAYLNFKFYSSLDHINIVVGCYNHKLCKCFFFNGNVGKVEFIIYKMTHTLIKYWLLYLFAFEIYLFVVGIGNNKLIIYWVIPWIMFTKFKSTLIICIIGWVG
jgi:hypothetical protein